MKTKTKTKTPEPAAPAAAAPAPSRLRAAVAYFCGLIGGLANARSLVAVIMALWPIALFATLVIITTVVVRAGAFWILPAFVLPLAAILLRAGPKAPPGP
jgi:predicted lipid-binding transport protein (Tim44 family)